MLPMTPHVHYDSCIPLSTVHIGEFLLKCICVAYACRNTIARGQIDKCLLLATLSKTQTKFFNDMYIFFKNAFFDIMGTNVFHL